jgi:iron complex outermembrane recepter protein
MYLLASDRLERCNRGPLKVLRALDLRWVVLLMICGMSVMVSAPAGGSQADTLRVYWLEPMEVTATRLQPGEGEFSVSKDYGLSVFGQGGFSLITKGIPFASDLYADGHKRGEISVVIDGERYPNACPNRMDPPAARVNPLEMGSVDLAKTSSGLHSGIGGAVSFHRASPEESLRLKGGLSGSVLSGSSADAAFSVDSHRFRFAARVVGGEGHTDARGRSFADLYSYTQDPAYSLKEFSLHGERGEWQTGASLSFTSDVPFPYLHMDERTNTLWNLFLSYHGNKVYVNRTHHTMDNGLRSSPMSMSTDARNLTVGLTGRFYDVYYRNWDADNEMSMRASPGGMPMRNHIVPDIGRFAAAVRHSVSPAAGVVVSGKVGFIHDRLGDEDRLAFYRSVHPSAQSRVTRASLNAAVSISRPLPERGAVGFLAEFASDAPQPEDLFVSLKRMAPMGQRRPWWSGNPSLAGPKRGTVRGRLSALPATFEVYGTRAWDYVAVRPVSVDGQPYKTYENVSATIMGFQAKAEWRLLSANAHFTRAQNISDGVPMAETPPLTFEAVARSPRYRKVQASLSLTRASSQSRVDGKVDEEGTPSWTRLDARVTYAGPQYHVTLEIANLTNTLYYQHLSYLRDPFSSGNKVYEPGRTARLSVSF